MTKKLEVVEEGTLLIDYQERGRRGKYSVPYIILKIEGRPILEIRGIYQEGRRISQPYAERLRKEIYREADCATRGIEHIRYLS